MKLRHISFLIFIVLFAVACNDDAAEPTPDPVPDTYAFERGSESSVSYTGQDERLDMVEEIKSKLLAQGDAGNIVSEQALLDAYENAGGNGGGLFSFTSTKQLKDKTFGPDLDDQMFETFFSECAQASVQASEGAEASSGQAGLIVRENSGNTILLDANGREFTQLIEKGLMGAVFYHQIFNVYLTDARVGDQVDNDVLVDGQNYTAMEHHWDEAFGYWNPPLDFTSPWPESRNGETRFWSRYSNTVDNVANGMLGTNKAIMEAFIKGRAAIVSKNYEERDAQREVLYDQLELVAAGVTVHYINSTLKNLNDGKTGEALHTLTEAWAFANAIKYSPLRRLTFQQIEEIKESDFGADGNFWNVSVQSLNKAKNTLVTYYPELAPVRDAL